MSTEESDFDEKLAALTGKLPRLRIVREGDELKVKSHDFWMRSLMERRRDGGGPVAEAILCPTTSEEVAAVLAWASETETPVVPFGLGSGVCGGVIASAGQVVLDLGLMDKILDLNKASLMCTVQPGMNGAEYEQELQKRGYTMGHWPQSIAISSVGGWCATRASGQLSTLYGNIEQMLLGCEVALPNGKLIRVPAVPRSSTGSDLRQVFMGTEGTLGVFTELTFRIYPKASHSVGRAFTFPEVIDGLEAIRLIMREGWTPAVTRLYDGAEAGRHFSGINNGGKPVLLLMSEGNEARIETEAREMRKIVEACGGTDEGSDPVDSWMEHRNTVPVFDDLLEQGLVVDTIEVAISWDKIGELWEQVTAAGAAIENVFSMTGHVSHSYTQGGNIYFTFIGTQSDMDQAISTYDEVWNTTLEVTHALGGTIAHHHGIGRIRREWLTRELGDAVQVQRAIKRAIDPKGIMNPGVLIEMDD